MASKKASDITLYFLQASRSIRVAWLLEELELPYKLVFYPRENNKAPASFRADSGNALAKAPALRDGDLTVAESGAITEYLIETYDTQQALMGGADVARRNKIRQFVHAAEGTFMVHCLSITYARWFSPRNVADSGDLSKTEQGLAINVVKDMDWLEGELEKSGGRFLVGDAVTAADTMCLFSVQFIFAKDLCGGRKLAEWKGVEAWVAACEATETWKRAVEKTGHEL